MAVGMVGVVRASAGRHEVSFGFNCPDSAASGYDLPANYWGLVLGE